MTSRVSTHSLTHTSSSSNQVVEVAIKCVFERFERALSGAHLRPPVTFVVFFLNELCNAPAKTVYWRRLVDMIPTQLFFSLARLDSASIPLAAFMTLFDGGRDERTGREVLRYACMMRKYGHV